MMLSNAHDSLGDAVARLRRSTSRRRGEIHADRERAQAVRVTEGDRARSLVMATIGKGTAGSGIAWAIASLTRWAGWMAISAAMISRSKVELNVTPR